MPPRPWNRLRDRRKWPRSWWYPTLPDRREDLPPQEWKEQHDETSKIIRRVMFTLIGYSFFCVITLGAPDISLLATDAEIELPFTNTKIGYTTFLLIGPFVLLGIASYMHVFVSRWAELNRSPSSRPSLPYAFNLHQQRVARWFSGFVFYWLVPLVMTLFAFKTSQRPEGRGVALLTLAVAFGFLWLNVRRSAEGRPHSSLRLTRWGVASLIVFCAIAILLGTSPFHRHLDLLKAQLSNQDLRWMDFHGAKLIDV